MKEIKDVYYSSAQKSSADLTFYAAGYQQTPPSYRYGPIVRNYHVIHFVSKGKGTLTIRQKTYSVKAGEAFFIPAQIPAMYQADVEDPWDYCWISFLGLHASGYMNRLLDSFEQTYVSPLLDVSFYRKKIEQFVNNAYTGMAGFFQESALVYSILSDLYHEFHLDQSELVQHHPMEEVKYWIDMNIGKDLQIKKIAEQMGYHPNYLIRKFTEVFGISPKQYILNVKMAKAKTLIEENEDPIALIADALGFHDLSSFSRTFKKNFSISPSEYRKTIQKKEEE